MRALGGISCAALGFLLRLDIVDGILHGRDLLGVLIRNVEVERFFERHHQLDYIKRVGAEIIDKARGGIDLGFIHPQLLYDDLLDLLLNGHAPSRDSLATPRFYIGVAGYASHNGSPKGAIRN